MNLGSETETENEIDVISPVSSSTRPSPESENQHIHQILQPFKEQFLTKHLCSLILIQEVKGVDYFPLSSNDVDIFLQ